MKPGDLIKIKYDGVLQGSPGDVREVIGIFLNSETVYNDFYIVTIMIYDGSKKSFTYDDIPDIEVLSEA